MNALFNGRYVDISWLSAARGASNKAVVGKISSFLSLTVNISKMVADTAKVTIND